MQVIFRYLMPTKDPGADDPGVEQRTQGRHYRHTSTPYAVVGPAGQIVIVICAEQIRAALPTMFGLLRYRAPTF